MEIRKAFQKHKRHYTIVSGVTMTKQSMARDCDINNIMQKYQKTGLLNHVNEHEGNYGNFIGCEDYHTSQNLLLEAEKLFDSIPSSIRKKFENSPYEFLQFTQNPENSEQMIELGLAKRPAEAVTAPKTPKEGQPSTTTPNAPKHTPEGQAQASLTKDS